MQKAGDFCISTEITQHLTGTGQSGVAESPAGKAKVTLPLAGYQDCEE